VLRAELILNQDTQDVVTKTNASGEAKQQLAILLGLPGSVDVRPRIEQDENASDGFESTFNEAHRERHSAVELALIERQDLRASRIAIAMAQQVKHAIWWEFLPRLDVQAALQWAEASGFANKHWAWNVMLTANLPLYDGGFRYANLHEAHSKIREALSVHRSLQEQAQSEVIRLRSELASATAGIASAKKSLELARLTAQDMHASFQTGSASQLDVLDAEQRLFDAEIELTTSHYHQDLLKITLSHALGKFDPFSSPDHGQ
jgi:outer membrane protein TolC